VDSVRLISEKDLWWWDIAPAVWQPEEDTLVLTRYFIKCHYTEERVIEEIPSVINHESLHRELSKLIGTEDAVFLDNITFSLEELLHWTIAGTHSRHLQGDRQTNRGAGEADVLRAGRRIHGRTSRTRNRPTTTRIRKLNLMFFDMLTYLTR